jgi:hypothetical protein
LRQIVMSAIACSRVLLEAIALWKKVNNCDDARKTPPDQPTSFSQVIKMVLIDALTTIFIPVLNPVPFNHWSFIRNARMQVKSP